MSQQVSKEVQITGALGTALTKKVEHIADPDVFRAAMADPKLREKYLAEASGTYGALRSGQEQIEGGLTVIGAYTVRALDWSGKASTEAVRFKLGKDITSGRVSQLRRAAMLVDKFEIDPRYEKSTFLVLAKHVVSGDLREAQDAILKDDTLKSGSAKREALLSFFRGLGWSQDEAGEWSFTAPEPVQEETNSGQDTTSRGVGDETGEEKVETVNGVEPARNRSVALDNIEANLAMLEAAHAAITTKEHKRLTALVERFVALEKSVSEAGK